jgi:anti-sigma regulatory factor (Ser/Thr protein kinase)
VVSLGIDAYDDRLVLEVIDNGLGFDGAAVAADDIYAPSGRGIMFMHALMDRVEFAPAQGGGTKVRLVKHRPSEAN